MRKKQCLSVLLDYKSTQDFRCDESAFIDTVCVFVLDGMIHIEAGEEKNSHVKHTKDKTKH